MLKQHIFLQIYTSLSLNAYSLPSPIYTGDWAVWLNGLKYLGFFQDPIHWLEIARTTAVTQLAVIQLLGRPFPQ